MILLEDAKATEIARLLVDDFCRRICLSIMEKSLSIEEISTKQHVSINTCYRKIHELQEYGLVAVDKIEIEKGKKLVRYLATFKGFSISLESGRFEVDMIQNQDSSDRLNEMLSEMTNPVKEQVNASALASA